jgi:hypothetical protein
MTLEEAIKITDSCSEHFFFQEEISKKQPPSLEKYSLQELLDANRMVKEQGTTKNQDGSQTIRVHCDDRLVAALYCLYHYPANDPSEAEVIVSKPGGAAVLVVNMRRPEKVTA